LMRANPREPGNLRGLWIGSLAGFDP